MIFNADLHIHGRYSAATSREMDFPKLARGAEKKGIQMLATGDCLHPKWLKEIRAMEEISEGTFQEGNIYFILTTEVEAEKRVHHLLLFPSVSSVEAFSESLAGKTQSLSTDGRPKLYMTGEEIGEAAKDADALFGPAHAFTPWTGMYAHFDSLEGCYGDLKDQIKFLELGLSAETDYADRIAELADLTLLSNSDAHSPQPVRIAREYNTIEAEDMTYDELRLAITRKKGRKFVMNVGLPPGEGKYNRTACTRCYKQYELEQVLSMRWRCTCRGTIKKGVRDRAIELGGGRDVVHPPHRPEYRYMIPLSEIVMRTLDHSSPFTGGVRAQWEALVKEFDNEIQVLMHAPPEDIERIAGKTISGAILAFREGEIRVVPGGGGKYGTVILPGEEDVTPESPKEKVGQQSIFDY